MFHYSSLSFIRDIQLNTRLNLIEVRANTKEAIFENLDQPGSTKTFKVIPIDNSFSSDHFLFSVRSLAYRCTDGST